MSAHDLLDSYALGRTDAETWRLIQQGHIYAPYTRQFLVEAGITAGMKVLDVGSGAGDVALLLADLVGPQGKVVGTDTNAAILEVARARSQAAGWTNMTFLAGDAQQLSLDADYDAVVGRWVLMYTPDPIAVLRRLSGALRPGGVVAFQEIDFTYAPMAYPQTPLFESVSQSAIPHVGDRPPGAPDPQMGLRLYQTYLDAGLPTPRLRLDMPIGGGADWPGYSYLVGTLRSLLPFLQRTGMASPEALQTWGDLDTLPDRLRDEALSARSLQVLPALIGAWARKP